MRISAFLLVLFAIACGDGTTTAGSDAGEPPAESCSDLRAQFDSLVSPAASRACAVDTDCTWIADGCFHQPGCATFVNTSVAAAARDLETRGVRSCLCGQCLALRAACNNGVCGLKMP